eukprot:scaffold8400_cov135-Skeletonema_menzelii.AAC.2
MSGKHHHKHHNNILSSSSLHQPIGATRIIPLAPPAIATKKEHNNNKLKSNLQHWAAWLSPRVTRPISSRIQQRNESNNDDDDHSDDGSKKRHHPILIQRPRGSSLDRRQADNGRGATTTTTSTTSSSGTTCAGDLHRGWNTKDRDLLSQSSCRSGPPQQQQQQHQSKRKNPSLLTTFLLYFDALLPEYFTHFPSASDIENNGAANAVSVLERGARTVQLPTVVAVSPIYKRHTHGSSGDRHESYNNSGISSNHSHFFPETSPVSRKNDGEQCSNINDTPSNTNQQQQHRQHHQWLTREKVQRVTGQVSPIHHMKFNSTLQAEWERFTSPFLMLAGAEVLYGEMEHVLDPETERRFANGESPLVIGSQDGMAMVGSSSTAVKFDNNNSKEQNNPNIHSPEPSLGDSNSNNNNNNKRGSRRLIAMYRQVREDFIIVGEYLCDPVLGSHTSIVGGGGGASVTSNNDAMMEFTPQSTFELSPGSSPQRYARSKSQPVTPENKRTTDPPPVQLSPLRNLNQEASSSSSDESQRQIAARSLRDTLNALIAFIDARCVLVKIHADLCCWSNVPLSSSTAEGGRGGNKWAMLAEQCRSILLKISFWTFNKDSMVQLALSKLETETKALELALLSVYHLMECE